MKGKKSITVFLFIGLLLIVIFAVGQICEKNPAALLRNPSQKGACLEDFLKLQDKIAELGIEI